MSRYKENTILNGIKGFALEHLPHSGNNIKQIIIKLSFILCAFGILVGGIYYTLSFSHIYREYKLIASERVIFKNNSAEKSADIFLKSNKDYTAWLSSPSGLVEAPIYKTEDNSFYMNHNSKKQTSIYGSLCLDYRFNMDSKNTVIYGSSDEEGILFGNLNYLRLAQFYEKNSVLTITTADKKTTYDIYAVFVLNAKKEQDGGKIYNIYRQNFRSKSDLKAWVEDAKNRSIINTGISVSQDDKILTLVTRCDDFDDARLVVMARSRSSNYSTNTNFVVTANSNPKYPKIWYADRNIPYPFESLNTKLS